MFENLTKNLENVNDIKSIMVGKNKKILEFGLFDDSATQIFKNNNCTITQLTFDSKNKKNESKFADKIISGNIDSLNIKKLFENEKFDVITIDKILVSLQNPTVILQQLQNLLEKNGFFICVIPNFLCAPNRIFFLNGYLNFQSEIELINNTNLSFYLLDSFLLLLDKANLKITQLNRIKQKSNLFSNSILNNLSFSNNIVDSILKDPESETIFYVLKVESGQNISPKLRQYLLQTFPKNIVSNNINSKNEFLQKVISDKDEMISGLETTISDKDIHLQKVISDKDKFLQRVISDKDEMISGLDQTISDKDKFLQRVISDKDEMISGLDQTISDKDERIFKTTEDFEREIEEIKKSKVWKLLRKLDSLRNKT